MDTTEQDTTYNGHASWQHCNVSLWINNDEPIYREAYRLMLIAGHNSAAQYRAAQQLLDQLPEKTPDGAVYTLDTVKAAIEDILD